MMNDHPRTEELEVAEGEEAPSGIDPEALVGVTLGGRYAVEAPLGKGGMGVVYLASQSALNRKVVIKVLGRGLTQEREAVARFEREALGLSQLTHPNIVTIYDFGRDGDQAYIVMEYIDGEMLSEAMTRLGQMDFETFAATSAQILAALAEAHDRGIIHRDIKPSNIMLCERHGSQNFVKVLDFGLVKLLGDAAEVTKKQNLVGSVAFLAPEQILGLEFDQRADVYALGVLFYYMLTGSKPFCGEDDIAVLYQHIHRDAAPLHSALPPGHEIPEALQELVHACLNKDPAHRPQSARVVLQAMQQELNSRSAFALPWTSGEFAAISRESVMPPRHESGLITTTAPRRSEETPSSRRQIPTLVRDSSGQFSPVSEPSLKLSPERREGDSDMTALRPVAPELNAAAAPIPEGRVMLPTFQNKATLLLGVALIVLIAGGGAALLYRYGETDPASSEGIFLKATTAPDPSSSAPGGRFEALLSEVDGLISGSRWGEAESLLGTVDRQRAEPAELRQLAVRENAIAVGRLLHKAALAEANQERELARDHYRAVLERDPQHALATSKLAAYRQQDDEQAANTSRAQIMSRPTSRVFLDGMELGTTPLDVSLETGDYTLEFRAEGHLTAYETLRLEPGEIAQLNVRLAPRSKRASPSISQRASSPSDAPAATTAPSSAKPEADQDTALLPVETPLKPGLNTDNGLLPVGN